MGRPHPTWRDCLARVAAPGGGPGKLSSVLPNLLLARPSLPSPVVPGACSNCLAALWPSLGWHRDPAKHLGFSSDQRAVLVGPRLESFRLGTRWELGVPQHGALLGKALAFPAVHLCSTPQFCGWPWRGGDALTPEGQGPQSGPLLVSQAPFRE